MEGRRVGVAWMGEKELKEAGVVQAKAAA